MPAIFFVTQGQAYWFENRDGYIWAPNPSETVQDRFFWRNVESVKVGDVIIHYAGALNGGISAISQATTNCFDSPITEDLRAVAKAGLPGVADWVPTGRRVNCRYVNLQNKMSIKEFKSDILRFKRDRYCAFNKNGGVCQGYLYELEEPIARKFIKRAIELNPYLKEHEFITDMLKFLERT